MNASRDGQALWSEGDFLQQPSLLSHPPLVGRQQVIQSVGSTLRGSTWGGAVLAGRAGVGKTRLLRHLVEGARERGLLVLHVQADSANGRLPLAGLVSAMSDLGMKAPASVAEAVTALADAQRLGPVLICVDDAHHLDDHSAAVILQSARRGAAKLVIVSCESRPCSEAVTALWKEGWLARIAVDPLGSDEAAQVVEAMLGKPMAPVTSARFSMLADGNLVALRELLASALEEGALAERSGVWVESDDGFHSTRLAALMQPALQHLTDAERWALDVLCVARTFPLEVATEVAQASVWERLESRGLIAADDGPDVRLSVSDRILSAAVLQELPVLRRRRILRLLTGLLDGHPVTREASAPHLVEWRLELGERVPEAAVVDVCRKAWWNNDWQAAYRLADSAWKQHRTPEIGLMLARILTHCGHRERAESLFATVAEIGTAAHRAEALKALERIHLVRGTARGEKHDGPRSTGPEPSGSTRDIDDAIAGMLAGRPGESLHSVQEMVGSDDPTCVAMAGSAALVALLSMGRPLDCVDLEPRLVRAAEAMHTVDVQDYDALNLRVLTSYARALAGEAVQGEQELRALIREAADRRNGVMANRAGLFLARLLFDRGQVRDAYRLFVTACEDDLSIVRQVAAAGALCSALHDGDDELIRTAAERLETVAGDEVPRVEVQVARALFEMHKGRVDTAVRILDTAGETALASCAYGELADVLHALARIDRAEHAARFMGAWTAEVQGVLDRIRIDFAEAAALRDPDALSACAHAFEKNFAALYASEAWASASRAYRRRGEPRLAAAAHRRCAESGRGYDGMPTHLLHMMDELIPLSRREREIALQASAGFSNKEIAEQLVLSVRTVDNHLYRVYRKLGVTNRRALRRMIDEQGS
ncbi:LuxR C-terminal-related transcriptional regulator [Streptomyces sp. NPDC054861]